VVEFAPLDGGYVKEREPIFGRGLIPFLYWMTITAIVVWLGHTYLKPVIEAVVYGVFGPPT